MGAPTHGRSAHRIWDPCYHYVCHFYDVHLYNNSDYAPDDDDGIDYDDTCPGYLHVVVHFQIHLESDCALDDNAN